MGTRLRHAVWHVIIMATVMNLVDEFPRQADSVNMFCCAETASFHSPFCVQTRGSVTGDVTCPQSSGIR